jgi:hypothetical protein
MVADDFAAVSHQAAHPVPSASSARRRTILAIRFETLREEVTIMFLLLSLAVLTQAPSRGAEGPKESAARLEFMKKSVAMHRLQSAEDSSVVYRIQTEPALRFTNTVGTVTDGTIFFWLDVNDRPVAAVQVYRTISGGWHQAFSSLSTARLAAGQVWNPARAGVTFKPIPGAPKPAATAEQRMRQMRDLLGGFKAEMNLELKTWHHLRPLTKPLLRYGKAGTEALDGVVFGFVLTTDPEVYLLLEAHKSADGMEWQYAFAPEASAPIRCFWNGKDAWTFDFTSADNDSRAPYFDWGFSQEP